ncbi:MAG TPA: gephyrin-like molybdotransferase Glp [Thermoanaerobaculia bacterium]|jgi:molybdenum cofactor synthesis domain-containing protein|nr:gephyrin-like molybdotransferase Glp [Thermoanaerobaculia bacterium]
MAPIAPDEAWRRIASRLALLPEESAERQTAAGRVLARDLAATVDVPAADVSAMDGYAAAGEIRPGERRPVAGTIAAGDPPGFELVPPAVVRIMTGATLASGADRVIPVEATDGGRETVLFRAGAEPGENVRRRGEILQAGDPLLPAGARLTPGALALLVTHGYVSLPVHRTPSVAVLTTGDEVVPPEQQPAPGQLRDSNTDFLLAAGASLELHFTSLGIAPDRVDALRSLIARGLQSDVLLLCGGVSMGEFDLVEGVLAELGCEMVFDGVAIQPGKPLVFATAPEGRLVFGLPGNPASVMVGFWLFVRPALRRLMGIEDSWWGAALAGTLDAPLPGAGPRDRFLPAELKFRGGEIGVTPVPPKGSHDLAAYARGTALVRVKAGEPPAPAGERCEVLLLTL